MKLTSLLVQYLYSNQRLDLPGIGSFTLDRSVISSFEHPKQKLPITEGVRFESNPGLSESPDFIAFISGETGKMKSLAMADLDSYIELAKQFLNIGKPFTIEGLGTLIRRTTGEVEFTTAFVVPERTRPVSSAGGFTEREEAPKKYESFLTEPRKPAGIGKPLVAMLVIGGIVLAVVAGYLLSKKSAAPDAAQLTTVTVEPQPEILPETTGALSALQVSKGLERVMSDSAKKRNTEDYKYVLEIAKSERAFKRYKQLRTNLWKVQLETTDSIDYKLFLMIPALNADTSRIVDSLTAMTGRKVYIEYN